MQGKWEPNGQWRIAPPPPLSPHQRIESYFSVELSSWRRWYLLQGACLIALGLLCLWAATFPTIAQSVSMEMLLILAGAVALISPLRVNRCPGLAWSLALAGLSLATGAYLFGTRGATADPGLVLAAYFAASGVMTLLLAVEHRRRLFHQWEWLTVSGVANLILALLILSGLPGPFTWIFGVLLGVSFIFDGTAFVTLALTQEAL